MGKSIYLSLVHCAVRCEAVAAECSASDRNEDHYQKILVYLDCASVCRQVAMYHLRGTEKTHLVAKNCIHVCETCLLYTLSQQNEKETAEGAFLDAIQSCLSIIDDSRRSEQRSEKMPANVFYGVEMNRSVRY